MKYCDRNGEKGGEAAFRAIYGDSFRVEQTVGAMLHLVEAWDSGLEAGMDCQVVVRGNYPNGARAICEDGGITGAQWKAHDTQEVLFFKCYAPPDVGAYSVYVVDAENKTISDVILGLSWICETSHRHVQRLVFEAGEVSEPEPGPEPCPPDADGDNWTAVFSKLDLIIEMLERE